MNHTFKSGNIIWTRYQGEDETITDHRGQTRIIKRYVGRNRGKDYNKPKNVFSVDTGA